MAAGGGRRPRENMVEAGGGGRDGRALAPQFLVQASSLGAVQFLLAALGALSILDANATHENRAMLHTKLCFFFQS